MAAFKKNAKIIGAGPLIVIETLVFLSHKLNKLGIKLLSDTEKRLVNIDNVSEIALEVSALKSINPLLRSFDKVNNPYNRDLNSVYINTSRVQIILEGSNLLIILISMIAIISGITKTSVVNYASTLAVLSRMVPSITRSISYYSLLQYGLAPVKRLAKLKFT